MNVLRGLMAIVAGVAVMGVLFQAGPRQAFACTCAPLPDGPERARQYLDSSDALVVGLVEERLNGEATYPEARVKVERSYKGEVPAEITVRSANCNGIIVDFKKGERWLMTLDQRDGGWQAHGCSAGVLNGEASGSPLFHDGDLWLAALNEIAPPVLPATADDQALSLADDDGGPAVAVAAAIAGLAMVVVASAYAGRRRARV
jgi:hypothetical protein